jgi:transcriptional regulator with XRE-family HTH domain
MINLRNSKILKAVGKQIRIQRRKKGVSQQEFADMCDMELSQINRIELGKVNTTVSTLFRIAEVLEIKASKLLDVDEF